MRSCNNVVTTPMSEQQGCPPGLLHHSQVQAAPVIYARIDHSAKQRNLSMANQAQTTVPLLIASSSSGGGGVSPSSIMNTSCESSASSGSASRCTRIHNPDFHPVEGHRCHSSSADEGFTSGSSPVNGATSNVPMVLSPQSSETTHLVSSSSCSTSSSSSSSSSCPPRRIPPAMECLARESTV